MRLGSNAHSSSSSFHHYHQHPSCPFHLLLLAFLKIYIYNDKLPLSLFMPGVSAIGPGAMPQTRMPNSPHSRPSERVSESIAALAADACAWYHVAPVVLACEMCRPIEDCHSPDASTVMQSGADADNGCAVGCLFQLRKCRMAHVERADGVNLHHRPKAFCSSIIINDNNSNKEEEKKKKKK